MAKRENLIFFDVKNHKFKISDNLDKSKEIDMEIIFNENVDLKLTDVKNMFLDFLKENNIKSTAKINFIYEINESFVEDESKLAKIKNVLDKATELGFESKFTLGENKATDMQTYIVAKAEIESFANKVNNFSFVDFEGKNRKPSVFEKYMIAYNFVADRVYKNNADDYRDGRSYASVLTSKNVVCLGFAGLLEALCSKIFNENELKCFVKYCSTEKKDGEQNMHSSHATNAIYIKDDLYNVDGYFHADACFDCKAEPKGATMTFALLPFCDLEQFKDIYLNFTSDYFTIEILKAKSLIEKCKLVSDMEKVIALSKLSYKQNSNSKYFFSDFSKFVFKKENLEKLTSKIEMLEKEYENLVTLKRESAYAKNSFVETEKIDSMLENLETECKEASLQLCKQFLSKTQNNIPYAAYSNAIFAIHKFNDIKQDKFEYFMFKSSQNQKWASMKFNTKNCENSIAKYIEKMQNGSDVEPTL